MDPNTTPTPVPTAPPQPSPPTAQPIPPPVPLPNTTLPPADPAKDDKLAQALIQSANIQYSMDHQNTPKKRWLSNKKLIYIGLSILVSILSIFIGSAVFGNDQSTDSDETTQQLLDTTDFVRDSAK